MNKCVIISFEVIFMDEQLEKPEAQAEEKVYVPRPAWQVWMARVAVVIVAAAFALYLYHSATGGM